MHTPTIPTFDPATQRPVMPSSMRLVQNALDVAITFEVGGFPGSPAMRFTLNPGDQAQLPASYCDPIPGANPASPRPSVLAMLTSVEAYPGGPSIQGVVPVADVAATTKRWARAKASEPTVSTVVLQGTDGHQVSVGVPKAGAPGTAAAGDVAALQRKLAALEAQLAKLSAPAAPAAPVPVAPALPGDDDEEIEPPPPGVPDLRADAPPAPPVIGAPARSARAKKQEG